MSYQVLSVPVGTSLDDHTQQQSEKLLGRAWYEGNVLPNALYFLLLFPLFGLFWWQYRLSPPLAWSMIGLAAYSAGYVADSLSTWQCFRLVPQFERRGLSFPYREGNPFMSSTPGAGEQMFNLSKLLSVGFGIIAWVVPGAGVAAGIAHGLAARSNQRKLQRLKVQLRLFDLHTGEQGGMG
jgi:hypothetical protein